MKVEYGCSTCKHRKDFLVPCDWLKTQNRVIFNCTRYEKDNPWLSFNNKFDELCKKGREEDAIG